MRSKVKMREWGTGLGPEGGKMRNMQAAAVGKGTLRGRESSTQVRQWEPLATKAVHSPDSQKHWAVSG